MSMVRILIKAFVGDEYFDGCDYALITINEGLAKRIAAARNQLLTLRENHPWCDNLETLHLFDPSASYFAHWRLGDCRKSERTAPPLRKDLLTAAERATLENEYPLVLSEPLHLHRGANEFEEDVFQPVQGERLVVGRDFFWWTAFLDDTNTYVATVSIAYDVLNRLI